LVVQFYFWLESEGLIFDVEFYGDQLQDFQFTQIELGNDNKETKKKRNELIDTWNNIMQGTQKSLQQDIDKYYKLL